MAMTVANNNTAALALGELNKNNNKLSKDLKKVSSGVRLNGAGDGAAEYSISEKMRGLIRSLNQDIDNCKKGIDIVKVAEGGIQQIIDELRDMKAMALNSANDHNSDIDRKILQKEFSERMKDMEDIAVTTNYNGKILLDGRYCHTLQDTISGQPTIISSNTSSTTSSSPTTTTTVGPTSTTKIIPTTSKTTSSTSIMTSSTPPSSTGIITTDPVTTSNTTTSTVTSTPIVTTSANSASNTDINSSGKYTTVTKTDITTTTTTTATTTTETTTTMTQNVTTTEIVSYQAVTSTTPEKPTIIANGTMSITSDGIYEFAPDYTGTLTISSANVEIMGPSSGAQLKEVYLVDNGVEDLYLKNVSIENSMDKSTIAFDSSMNTLHLLGSNTIVTHNGTSATDSDMTTAAVINAGNQLSIVGNGNLSITRLDTSMGGAAIGSDAYGTCGGIYIGQNISISIRKPEEGSAGAGIGSGWCGACGNIYIGSNSTIDIDMCTLPGHTGYTAGAAIGSGNAKTLAKSTCGDIVVYSGAKISAIAAAAAGIGCSSTFNECGNITIYSNAQINASSSQQGAGIGHGFDQYSTKCGNITIYSYYNGLVTASSINSGVQGGSVKLLSTENILSGGIADDSELSLGEITETIYEITTETITKTETLGITNEKKTTQYDTYTEILEIVTKTIYEDITEITTPEIDSPIIIHTGPKANQNLHIYINDMRPNAMGLADVAVDPREKALEAIDKLDTALEYALNETTRMGAYQVRLNETIETLTTEHENTIAAESTIRDSDMAKEMMNYIKDNILSQAAQAMLSQANQSASTVLGLLQ